MGKKNSAQPEHVVEGTGKHPAGVPSRGLPELIDSRTGKPATDKVLKKSGFYQNEAGEWCLDEDCFKFKVGAEKITIEFDESCPVDLRKQILKKAKRGTQYTVKE